MEDVGDDVAGGVDVTVVGVAPPLLPPQEAESRAAQAATTTMLPALFDTTSGVPFGLAFADVDSVLRPGDAGYEGEGIESDAVARRSLLDIGRPYREIAHSIYDATQVA